MAFLDAGGIRLYLGQAEGSVVRSQPLLYFSVDDIEASHAALRSPWRPFVSAPTSSTGARMRTCGWPSSAIRTAACSR